MTDPAASQHTVRGQGSRVLYVVATVHLDTQWRWTVQDTIREFLPATLQANFSLLERYPFFSGSFEGAVRYMLMQEYYPREFERLKELVATGRWRVAGSMLDAPDVNVVSPESLIRHILYGNRFFQSELGRASCDVFLPDCFGFGQALPSVAAHCRLRGFSSQKFGRWMAPAKIPFDIGFWQGPDGAGVAAALRPEGYGEGLRQDLSLEKRFIDRLDRTGQTSGAFVGLKYVGIGDRGGGLDERSMQWLQRSRQGKGPVQVRIEGSDQLFRDLTPEQVERLPRHRGELLLPTHGTGCLTSQAAMKRWNRKNELLADAAERAAVIAEWLGGLTYPKWRLRQAWIRFLWHQMHDDLTGTSIPQAYRFSWRDELLALAEFSAVLTQAVGSIATGLDTRTRGHPVVVFNPLSIARQDIVEARLPRPNSAAPAVRVIDPDGREVPAQMGSIQDDFVDVQFLAHTPPLSLGVWDISFEHPSELPSSELRISDSSLENHRYRVLIDAQGDVSSLCDKQLNRELLSAPCHLQMLPDRSSRWPAWEILFEDISADAAEQVSGPAAVRILEHGPARVCLEIVRRARGSQFIQHVRLAGGAAGDRLEIANQVHWRTRGRLLKAVFPLTCADEVATFDLGLGAIERGNRCREKYEVPAQQWADLSDSRRGLGVSILNDGKYGWDKPDDRTLRLSLLRSPRVRRKFRHQGTQDFGRHHFTYGLYGHTGDWRRAGTVWQAARLNQPPLAFLTRRHDGSLGRSHSFLETNSTQVAVRALKLAEDSRSIVVRLQELWGQPVRELRLDFAATVETARVMDGNEHETGPAATDRGALVTDLEPFAPATLALDVAAPPSRLQETYSQPVSLPFNATATSEQHRPSSGLDPRGHSLPTEQFPDRLESGGVEFRLGPVAAGAANVVVCRDQAVDLPSGAFNKLHLLAASIDRCATARLRIDDQPVELEIHPYTGWAARWREERHGLLRRQPVTTGREATALPCIAWYSTHRHDARGRDEPYVFCYIYQYWVDLPAAARRLHLPQDESIRLFAVSMARESITATTAAMVRWD
jgi:alpha-mannosidase